MFPPGSYSEKIPPPTPWQLSTRSVAQPCVVECGQFPTWTAIQAAKWGSKTISAFGFWASKSDFRAPDLDGNLTIRIVNWYPFFEPYPILRHWSPDGHVWPILKRRDVVHWNHPKALLKEGDVQNPRATSTKKDMRNRNGSTMKLSKDGLWDNLDNLTCWNLEKTASLMEPWAMKGSDVPTSPPFHLGMGNYISVI